MNKVEELLFCHKRKLDHLEVPDVLENRLLRALEKSSGAVRRKHRPLMAAAIVLLMLLIGYQADTLAYYGKKMVGYDQVMNGTLRQLNELGKGQEIDKSYTFSNGTTVTLEAVMLDDNQLLAFFKQKSPDASVVKKNIFGDIFIKGAFGRYRMKHGAGEMNDVGTVLNIMGSFDPPLFFEKKLTLYFTLRGQGMSESGEISFTLDRNKAMGHTLRKNIGQTVKVDEAAIRFDSILASPTKVVIKGTIQNSLELSADQIKGERLMPKDLAIALVANGQELPSQGAGISTNTDGIKFEFSVDALPPDLEKLQIKLISFGADHQANQRIPIKKGLHNQTAEPLGQNISIDNVTEVNGETLVTITTAESTRLTRVYLLADGNRIELKETVSDKHDKNPDGSITHTRTLHFPGSGNDLNLDVQRMTFVKTYNKLVDIPLD